MTYTDALIAIGTKADAEIAQAILDLAQTRLERDALAVQNVDLRQAVADLERRIAELESPEPEWVTMTDARLESGRTYDHVIFKGGGEKKGVLHIDYPLSNVTLRDCIIESGPQNGWTINSKDGVVIENLTAERLTIRSQPRMGLEFTDRTVSGRKSANWRGIDLIDVTVDPQGSEAVSFCGDVSGVDLYIRDMLIRGAGNRPDLYSWGQGFELNAPKDVTVDGLTIWQTRGSAFNLTGPGTGAPCDWTFRNVTADMRITDPAQTQPMSSTAQVLYAKNMTGSVWRDCLIAAAGTGSWCGYITASPGNDFTGVTWIDERVSTPKVGLYNGSTGNVGLPN